MRAVVVGTGAVGARAARQLLSAQAFEELVIIDTNGRRAGAVAASLGPPATVRSWDATELGDGDVAVLAVPDGHRALAQRAVEEGAHVVSVADAIPEVRSLLDLDAPARERGTSVVVGAGFAPGLTCVLARHAAAGFDVVDEVHVAKAGTGGPACARQHHKALSQDALDWRDGAWTPRRGGSGRELCWFPDPTGGRDCYRAGLPDALLVAPAFPGVRRVTARVAASRRDRLTAGLPMLRRPHAEGLVGAARVEVRGRRGAVTDVRVLGVFDRPGVVAGVVAGLAGRWAVSGQLARTGAGGLAELIGEPVPFLRELARYGIRAAAFEGEGTPVSPPLAAP